jgi:DNA-binding IclR family transcriptional regulator
MKSLRKAIDILEYVINHNQRPVTPSEIAEQLGLNAATCVRIMGEYTKLGYLEQISRREGYVPGPAVFTFADRMNWKYARMAKASAGPVRELAETLNTVINISVMRDTYRYMLYHFSGNPLRNIPMHTRYGVDHYETATGRLLMSTCSDKELEIITGRLGFPGDEWDGINDLAAFKKELSKIADSGTVCFRSEKYNQWILGVLVKPEGYPCAAIGYGVDGDNWKEALAKTENTAKQIEYILAPKNYSL